MLILKIIRWNYVFSFSISIETLLFTKKSKKQYIEDIIYPRSLEYLKHMRFSCALSINTRLLILVAIDLFIRWKFLLYFGDKKGGKLYIFIYFPANKEVIVMGSILKIAIFNIF